MEILKYISERIRDLRSNYGGAPGISQDALAKNLGVSTNTVSRWETGVYKPAIEDLDKLARFFGVSILTFFPPEGQPVNNQVAALMRAATNLTPGDLEELTRYAEWRRAQNLLKSTPGRKRKRDDDTI